MSSFASIDFETARENRNSACALGLTIVDTDEITYGSWLIRPPDNRYDDFNISIHGIRPADTANEKNFDEVWDEVADLIGSRLVIAHNTAFDMYVLQHSAKYWEYKIPDLTFACTYRLARETWPERWTYKLSSLAEDFGIELNHHDALSDSNAAAEIAVRLCEFHEVDSIELVAEKFGYKLGSLLAGAYSPFSNAKPSEYKGGRYQKKVDLRELEATEEVDENHPLFGLNVVFTGTLETFTRVEAAQALANVGGEPQNNVTKKTDYLVMGITDLEVVGSDGMSSKMRKAVELAESGQKLEIIDESEFKELLGH